jgi:hypothetical protein
MAKLSSVAWALWSLGMVAAVGACTTQPPVSDGPQASRSSETVGAACVPVDDRNPCTEDVCESGVPKSKPTAAGNECAADGTRCDGVGRCVTPACFKTIGLPGAPSPGGNEGPSHVVAADLDGDGELDLVTANPDRNNVSVLLNLGKGTFAAPVNYAAGKSPNTVSAADLDGDGKLDLVTANRDSNDVSVLLNKGWMTFAAPVHYAAGKRPNSVAVADLDGDGKLDLVTSNLESDTVSVLLNLGKGTFAAPIHLATGTRPTSVAAADLDGDGKPDLVTASSGSNSLNVRLNSCLR